MKNLKVSLKLLVSFAIVIVLSIAVGVVGIIGMIQITTADSALYEVQTKPLPDIAKTLEYSQRLRIDLRNAILYSGNLERILKVDREAAEAQKQFEAYAAAYKETIVDANALKLFNEAMDIYESTYKPGLASILTSSKAGESKDRMLALMEEIGPATTTMVDNFTACMDIKVDNAKAASDANDALSLSLLILIIAVLAVAVAVAMLLAVYISRLISKPVSFMKDVLFKMGKQGVVNFSPEEYRMAENYASAKDEVADSIKMLIETGRRLETVGAALETVAEGDLTAELELLSPEDSMGLSLKKMVDNLNAMFGEIRSASSQVSVGSKQVADGSQSLAQGSTEQASAVQQLSASIGEISEKTGQNAGMAREAAQLSTSIMGNAEKGSTQMDQMMQAVREINDASNQIGKVIKVIDDIAFQTNILALNAAVEAARAGQHGKGFAVVAEEVRSLAGKSAAAAKDTGGMIENSIGKANFGMQIATETAESLKEIVQGITRSAEIVEKIALSSEEQANAIRQVNTGIDQVAQVVQQNSATAQESAAASEEMSGQSSLLQGLIANFKLRGEERRPAALPAAPRAHEEPRGKPSFSSNGGSLGKY